MTRLHVRPPPLTVRLCPPDAGPSDEANATTKSPAIVSNGSAVLTPRPSTITALATASLPPPARMTLIVVFAVALLKFAGLVGVNAVASFFAPPTESTVPAPGV